ncbi:MAG: glycerol-3-phosphate cytidylyltransferase [Coriobacteriales bacterium]|jgi:glycerol-3-phosphate cytidylyltransferase
MTQGTQKSINGRYRGLKRVLTYGTFDLLHYGHIRLLQRAAALGDYLVVALSTDEFNASKGKQSFYSYDMRREMLEAIRYVDLVIPEESWEQKIDDVREYHIDTVVMGGDWAGSDKFEFLRDYCDLVYLDRTPGISTTQVKQGLGIDKNNQTRSAEITLKPDGGDVQ